MNFFKKSAKQGVTSVQSIDDPASLDAFLAPGCPALVWRRPMAPSVRNWLGRIDLAQLPHGRVILKPFAAGDAVEQMCDISGLPRGAERDWLQADIEALASGFSSLMETKYIRLRLDVVTTNACRKFHMDAITARLVCTYRGTGTQYGFSPDGGDPEVINTVEAGSPILLRGSRWPETPRSGLLHRSPPIEGTGETRLVLVLDPVSDPDDEIEGFAAIHPSIRPH